jgi:hypothetical protein
MTIDEKLNRLIELVERMHEYNGTTNGMGSQTSMRGPSMKQWNDVGRELYALKQETPQVRRPR